MASDNFYREWDGEDFDSFKQTEQVLRSFDEAEIASADLSASSPRSLGVPHDLWRPNQLMALEYIQKAIQAGDRTPIFAELPTGSGKSAIPTALGNDLPVLVLVQSLALLDQYERQYGFSIVKGMQEYPCVLPSKIEYWTSKHGTPPMVSDCHFESMTDCPMYDQCPYIVAREKALASRRMACTYPFAFLSRLVQRRAGVGVWDEAHLAADTILNLSEMRFTEHFRNAFVLPPFPLVGYADVLTVPARLRLLDWLSNAHKIVSNKPKDLFMEDDMKWRSAAERIKFTMMSVSDRQMEYYFVSSQNLEQEDYRYGGKTFSRALAGMSIRPMSASLTASRLFGGKTLTVMMSATIGEPHPLATELGLTSFHYQYFPHPVPIAKRPVYDLGQARMTYDNLTKSPVIYRLQANAIIKFIKSLDPSWRGIILTSSYAKVEQLRRFIGESELGPRLYSPPVGQEGLSSRINAFLADPRPGLIVIDILHGWGHGLDLRGDLARFAIVASVPFGNHMDPFEDARRRSKIGAGANYAWWQSYMAVPQATGRVTRGELDADGEYLLNVAALADGSAMTRAALSYYPEWFREAISPLKM